MTDTTRPDGAVQVPLHELLRSVPQDARLEVAISPAHVRFIPVGRLCHEAAAALATQHPSQSAGEPVAIFSKGPWLFRETGQEFSGADLDAAAFAAYRDRLTSPPPTNVQHEAGEPVAYLDIGVGGYLDLGSDLTDEQLSALPKGRHMLGIIGTYGVDGYKAAAHPVEAQQAASGGELALPFAILDDELRALHRFYKTTEDGQDYTVPTTMMKRLAVIGLVRRVTGNRYEFTDFGLSVCNGDFASPQAPAVEAVTDREIMRVAGECFADENTEFTGELMEFARAVLALARKGGAK